jgi:sugar O-acyltransferase (sialic acid O-acetyltransferase NeuD family)
MNQLNIFGVATKYASEIAETCKRLELEYAAINNLATNGIQMDFLRESIATEGENCIVAPGNPTPRAKAVEACWKQSRPKFVSLIDPTSVVASTATIGCGVYVNSLVSIGSNSEISCHANINRSASLGHHSRVGLFSSIGPGAILCGSVKIGIETLVGAGAIILPNLEVGDNCIIGAGSVVTKSVPNGTFVLGSPARVVGTTSDKSGIVSCPQC